MDFAAWAAVLVPSESGQGAAVHAILSLQAVLSAIGVLMALYVAARAVAGLLNRPASSALDVTSLFLAYAGTQGLIGATMIRLFPMAS